MLKTTAQQERSLQDPAVCELLKVRDFLDNVMVRTDGCYVAGFRVQGAVTYFADDEGRNEAKSVVGSLLRAMPEQSMRIQFRYEVVESLNGLLDRYRDASRSGIPEVKVLDDRRLASWEEKERQGAYLSRIAGVYLIWDPVRHKRAMIASGGPRSREDRRQAGGAFTLSVKKAIQKTKKEHIAALAEFESIISGIESAMKSGGLAPERMAHGEIFLEIKRAFNPMEPDLTPLKENIMETREISARERLAPGNILGQTETRNIVLLSPEP